MQSFKKIWPSTSDMRYISSLSSSFDLPAFSSKIEKETETNNSTSLVDEKLDLSGRFQDLTLQSDYMLSCVKQKQVVIFSILSLFVLSWLVTDRYFSFRYYYLERLDFLPILSLSIFFLLLSCILTFYLLFILVSREVQITFYHSRLQVAFVICTNAVVLLSIIEPILFEPLECEFNTAHTLHQSLDCPPPFILLPMKLILCAVFCLLTVTLYEPRFYLIFGSVLNLAILLIYLVSPSIEICIAVVIFGTAFLLLYYDLHFQRAKAFCTKRNLEQMILERDKNEAVKHATEMRHMIGNIAHDLKTPLTSFISGIDVIKDIIISTQEKIELEPNNMDNVQEAFVSIQSSLADVRNTNAFMIMTINRCLDYTKASKGMKLVPKNETINLKEAIQFPVQCMSNIQERIGIKLMPLPKEICSHIITDKQWLQENILCLLSNAVKYSTGGVVTISIFIVDEKPISQTTKDLHDPQRTDSFTSCRPLPSSNSFANNLSEDASYRFKDPLSPVKSSSSQFNLAASSSKELLGTNSSPLRASQANIAAKRQSALLAPYFLQFEFEDNGIGISEEAMKSLFNPFKQAQRLAGGTGLGLYSLAKRIEALGGSYGVKKRKDGEKGSLFWFAIPYRPDSVTAASAKTTSMAIPENSQSRDSSFIIIPTSTPPTQPSAKLIRQSTNSSGLVMNGPPPFKPANSLSTISTASLLTCSGNDSMGQILLVDDTPSILKMTTMMFRRQGYGITTAENGAIALQKLEEKWRTTGKGFDLILMDLQMPVMDGLEATRRIREMEKEGRDWMKPNPEIEKVERSLCPEHHHQIIFGVSANSDDETMQTAFNAGIDDFLGKPFSAEIFATKLQTIKNGSLE